MPGDISSKKKYGVSMAKMAAKISAWRHVKGVTGVMKIVKKNVSNNVRRDGSNNNQRGGNMANNGGGENKRHEISKAKRK
jgi:hypothetical protein